VPSRAFSSNFNPISLTPLTCASSKAFSNYLCFVLYLKSQQKSLFSPCFSDFVAAAAAFSIFLFSFDFFFFAIRKKDEDFFGFQNVPFFQLEQLDALLSFLFSFLF
jgi:hypothetical protein